MSVIKNEKIYVEVGSSCLQDFLATDKISSIVWMAQFTQTLGDIISEGRELSGRCNPVYELELVVATAIKSISDRGYYSRAKAEEFDTCSTAGEVMYMMNGDRYNHIAPYVPTTEEREEAKKIIEYVKTITSETDYKYNLYTIANNENGYVSGRFVGYSVSMVPFYYKAMDLIIAREKTVPSNHVGTIGVRETFEVTLTNIFGFETQFGFMQIFKFVDVSGNVIVWKSTTGADVEIGKSYKVTASVKAHEEYKTQKQTLVLRPKFTVKES